MRSQWFWVVVLTLVALLSCAKATPKQPSWPPAKATSAAFPVSIPKTVFIDPSFKENERDSLYEALMAWTYATRGIVHWTVAKGPIPDGDLPWKGEGCSPIIVLMKMNSTSETIKNLDSEYGTEPGYHAVAYTQTSCVANITYFIWDRLDSESDFAITAKHELGHQLRLNHLPKNNLMSPSIDQSSKCITKADLGLFCKVHSCDAATLQPCD